MTPEQIKRVMKRHEIPACWHKSFCRLVNGEGLDDPIFGRLLRRDPAFKAALNTMLDAISAPFVRLFGDVPNLRALAMAGEA